MIAWHRRLIGRICRITMCTAIAVTTCYAQRTQPGETNQAPVGMVDQPCLSALQMPKGARKLLIELFIEPRALAASDFDRLTNNTEFKGFNEANKLRASADWAARCRFHRANMSALSGSPAPRVVFMGDSITENWELADPRFFEQGILNRGISGQTSEQMLVRFRADVIALHPRTVLILAGTNDIAGNSGPTSPQNFKNNIMSMAEIAHSNGIAVVLCSIPPTAVFNWSPKIDPKPRIKLLNAWLRDYAAQNHFEFVDYYPLLAGQAGEFRADLSNDGVHPNRSGYSLMRTLVEKEVLQSTK